MTPWRATTVVVIAGCAASIAGCGSTSSQSSDPRAGAGAQLASETCTSSVSSGSPSTDSCLLVLGDGQRFRCNTLVRRPAVTVNELDHTKGCARISRLDLSASMRAVEARIIETRSCLERHGLHSIGGPVFPPQGPGTNGIDGELDIGNANSRAFIAFLPSITAARKDAARVVGNAKRLAGEVEQLGAEAVLWINPSASERRAILDCAAS